MRLVRKTEKQNEVAPNPLQEGQLGARAPTEEKGVLDPHCAPQPRSPVQERKKSCYIWQGKSASMLSVLYVWEVSWKFRLSSGVCMQLTWCTEKEGMASLEVPETHRERLSCGVLG